MEAPYYNNLCILQCQNITPQTLTFGIVIKSFDSDLEFQATADL